jgi:hypothetical protein
MTKYPEMTVIFLSLEKTGTVPQIRPKPLTYMSLTVHYSLITYLFLALFCDAPSIQITVSNGRITDELFESIWKEVVLI